ncbi:MAG TPA: hypothetical protein VK420_13760, partial [Longimicrobium sp.]|nr:hypothetical protein [Longimicrobium sp.]
LTTQSDGNPLFVAEYLRAAINEGLLRRNEAGRWQWVAEGAGRDLSHEALQLPGAVRELVGRRLGGLSAHARFIIEAASVLGREFDGELLGKVACVPDQETLEALEELLRKDVVEETRPGRFRFGQNKLREVTYGDIEPDRRALFHHAAAEALEARHSGTDGFGLSYPLLAHHWAAAGVTDKTQAYLEKAAERSLRTGANAEAADFFRRALALEGEREDAASRQRRANWERKLGEALYGVGDVAGSKEHLLRAMRLLGWPMPRTQGAWTRLLMGQLGKQLLHLALPSRWLSAKDADRDVLATVALTAARLSECYYFNQEMLPTVALSLLAVNLAERTGRGGEIRRLYGHLGYLAGLGRLHLLARRYFARAEGEGQALEDPSAVSFGFILESMYHVTFARYALGADRAKRALEVLRGAWNAKDSAIEKLELGYVPPEVYLAKNLLAHVDFYEGRLQLAQQKLEDVSRLARAQSNTQYEAWTEMDMGRGMIAADQLDEAVHLLEHAHGLLKGKGDKSNELQSQGLLATALLYRGELTRAREVADGVAALMRDVQPSVFTEGCGFEGVALVYLAAWEREGRHSKETAARAWNAVSVLSRFSLLFPLARPAALRCAGKAHLLAGHPWRARWRWLRSVDIAQRLGMPYEAALTLLELGKHSAREPQRERYLRQARELLEHVGRPQQLRELEDGEKTRAAG